ncbi:hypothetical protein PE067_18920 [Paracoccus sp. DMF-8]|uniref:hypothetical protein n=1 Tax=Paracoccus sp. DMF-8 TaxID=3019445 RepID=UPI0023E3A287|nr:hypothetical protein [Paracoccus sp. DMF-8]MDF3608017.1 hypothetical protein [Paracoccus sp. DMF-8]
MIADPSAAQPPADGCSDPVASQLRGCTDPAASAIAGVPAWMACGGGCIVVQEGADARVLGPDGALRQVVPGARFLPGAGQTACLAAMPFLTDQAELLVLDDALHELARQSFAPFYAVDFVAEPYLLDTIALRSQMSCDGKRFFAPSLDGEGFTVLDIGVPFADQDGAGSVIVISDSGRYGLSVDSDGDGHYRLQDFDGGQERRIDAVFEIDMVFFDVAERYLLIRRAADPGHAEVLELPGAQSIGRAPLPQDVGLNLRVTGQRDALRLQPVALPDDRD